MILRRLVELAERLPDLPPTGYQPGFITKIVRLRSDGSLLDVVPTTGEKRGKREGLTMMVPREMPQRTSETRPRLLCDNANYVLGKTRKKDTPEKVAQRHAAYRALLEECVQHTSDPSVKAVLQWVDHGGPEALRDDPKIAEDDEFAFEVDGVRPVDLKSVRDFWANQSPAEHRGVCIATGRSGPIVARMPAPIKGIPGGQPSGTALISVNNPSGCSYGLEAAYNSPIGVKTAEQASNALNWLLSDDRHRLPIGKTVFVYWTREPVEFDLWNLLHQPDPAHVGRLISAVKRGGTLPQIDDSDFYVLALSAYVSRVVVRDYLETTLQRLQLCLGRWFALLDLVSNNGVPSNPPGLFALSASLYREVADMAPDIPAILLRSAITGAPLPERLLALAIRRNQSMQGPFYELNKRRRISEPRMALIKALIQQNQKEDIPLEALATIHPDPAYHCGRLLAALDRIQRAALGDINATVVDKFYGSACASPGSVLGALLNNAQSHLAKLRKDNRDYFHQLLLEEILSAIGPSFPRTLSLHRQGLFALGFYHQKAHDRAQATANKTAKEGATA